MEAEGTDDCYIISLSAGGYAQVDRPKQPDQAAQNRIKSLTVLRRPKHNDLHPAVVIGPRDDGIFLVYYFKKTDPVLLEDSAVEFRTDAAPVPIRLTFPLNEMMFDGKLAL